MSRRKVMGIRKPCGRLVKAASIELMSPGEIVRLREAASVGLRDKLWSSQASRLHLVGKINAAEFAAATRWAELTAEYSLACASPRHPRSSVLEVGYRSMAPDVDTPAGIKAMRKDERTTLNWLEAKEALHNAGAAVVNAVERICIKDQALEGHQELMDLKLGLQCLLLCWSERRRKARR